MTLPNTVKTVCLILMMLGFIACSDGPTDTEMADPDPPELPSLQSYQPDTEYFSNNSAQKETQALTGFEVAAQLMQFTVDPLFSSTTIYMPFFSQARETEPSYNDGVWEWKYSYSQFEQSAEIRLTAEPNSGDDEFSWALFISASSAEGPSFDDYRFMDGASKTDGSEGNWSIYPYEPGENSSAIVSFDWTREDEDNYTASYNIQGIESSATFAINYTKADVEHTLELSSSNGEYDAVVFWNSDTGVGYIDRGEKICWDSQQNNVPCQ